MRRQAHLRLALGQVQMAGSIIAAVLLVLNGVSPPVIWVVVVTSMMSLISIVLFQITWREKSKNQRSSEPS